VQPRLNGEECSGPRRVGNFIRAPGWVLISALAGMTLKIQTLPAPELPFGRLDARWKLVAFVVAAVCVLLLRHVTTAAVALGAALVVALACRLPWRWFVARLGAVAGFLALVFLVLPLLGKEPSWPSLQHGLVLAALVCLKTLAFAVFALVLLGTSSFDAILKASHQFRVPGLIIQLAALAYRYTFVLGSELARLRVALRVRGYRNRASHHCYRTVGHVAGTLLVRGYERAERVGQAMRCRGFQGRFRTLGEFHTGTADVALFLSVATGAAVLVYWDFVL
jgi:cobalt/nickel transport system permease protein